MSKKNKDSVIVKRIKDLPSNISLTGVHFRTPDGVTGYWYSQWGYEDGKAGVWYKKDMKSSAIFPYTMDKLMDALEWEVIDNKQKGIPNESA